MLSRSDLRKQLRAKRNQLTLEQQKQASESIAQQVLALSDDKKVMALYLANDGEISPQLAIEQLQQAGHKTLLPVMHSFRRGYLNFQLFNNSIKMVQNRFGINEPKLNATDTFALKDIDYILMPLVGFDNQGNRLGMGGGFYDRTLSKIQELQKRPLLVGLAHECQEVEQLPVQQWDVPIDLIITPTKKYILE